MLNIMTFMLDYIIVRLTLFRLARNTSYSGGVVLHTLFNFWTTNDRELKFYMIIDIHKLFRKIESDNYVFMTS